VAENHTYRASKSFYIEQICISRNNVERLKIGIECVDYTNCRVYGTVHLCPLHLRTPLGDTSRNSVNYRVNVLWLISKLSSQAAVHTLSWAFTSSTHPTTPSPITCLFVISYLSGAAFQLTASAPGA
jgi:hypothetical protein